MIRVFLFAKIDFIKKNKGSRSNRKYILFYCEKRRKKVLLSDYFAFINKNNNGRRNIL